MSKKIKIKTYLLAYKPNKVDAPVWWEEIETYLLACKPNKIDAPMWWKEIKTYLFRLRRRRAVYLWEREASRTEEGFSFFMSAESYGVKGRALNLP